MQNNVSASIDIVIGVVLRMIRAGINVMMIDARYGIDSSWIAYSNWGGCSCSCSCSCSGSVD